MRASSEAVSSNHSFTHCLQWISLNSVSPSVTLLIMLQSDKFSPSLWRPMNSRILSLVSLISWKLPMKMWMRKVSFLHYPSIGSFPRVDFWNHLFDPFGREWLWHLMRSQPGFGVTPRNWGPVSPSERITSSNMTFLGLSVVPEAELFEESPMEWHLLGPLPLFFLHFKGSLLGG